MSRVCYYMCCSYKNYKYKNVLSDIKKLWPIAQQLNQTIDLMKDINEELKRPIRREGVHRCRNHKTDSLCETNCCPYQEKYAKLFNMYSDLYELTQKN